MDMGSIVDLLEDAIETIAESGDIMLQEDFMMNIFLDSQDQIETFVEYLTFKIQDKMCIPVSGLVAVDDKVIPFDHLPAELFYPTKIQNNQTVIFCCRLAEEIATTMLIELWDPQKATANYLHVQWESTVRHWFQKMTEKQVWKWWLKIAS